MRKYKSLTLIELLIASSIFVVIIVTIYSAFHSGIFGYQNIEETIDIYQTARLILERINLDLRNSFAYKDTETKFTGGQNEVNFFTLVDTFKEDMVFQDFAFVSYKLEDKKLMRLCRRNQEALKEEFEIEPEEMADNAEIKFAYASLATAEKEIKFKDSWAIDSDEEKKILPLAVKVDLTIKGKTEQKFERIIYLPQAE